MFGTVRASPSPSPSPSPLDSLEAPPSKIIKDDSLSIYEATLMKLRLGSQHHLISLLTATETDAASEYVPEATRDLSSDAMNVEASSSSGIVSKSCEGISSDGEVIMTDTDCSSSTDRQSTGNLNLPQQSKSMSIVYLFSKFKGYQLPRAISHQAMIIQTDGSASCSSSSECQFLSRAKELGNQESNTSTSFPGVGLWKDTKNSNIA